MRWLECYNGGSFAVVAYNKGQSIVPERTCWYRGRISVGSGMGLPFLILEPYLVAKFDKRRGKVKVPACHSVQMVKREGKENKSENNYLC